MSLWSTRCGLITNIDAWNPAKAVRICRIRLHQIVSNPNLEVRVFSSSFKVYLSLK